MNDDDNSNGPNLGGGPSMPSLDNDSSSGPSGPDLGGGPSLDNSSASTSPSEEELLVTSKKKKKTNKINVHEIVRKWGVARRRVRDSIQTMMLREIKDKVRMTPVNEVFRRNVEELMQGQLDYFEEMIELINQAQDELSLELAEEGEDKTASTVVFDNLTEIVSREMKALTEAKPIVTEYIDEDLKRFRDARVEPKASWWVIWYTGLILREVRERSGEKLDIVLEVMLKYKPAQRRALGVYLNFADCLVHYLDPFPVEFSRMNLIFNPVRSGYNMAPWIKPRYETYSQDDMEYENFLIYYARSFGSVAGNAPDFEGSPLDGYRSWIQRSLSALEDRMRASSLLVDNARGNSLEGMLVGLKDNLEDAKQELEYDDTGAVTNHPKGIEGCIKFIDWLFHTGLNRFTTTNIAIHKEVRLSLDMFEFIPDTVRWVNEHGEMIVMDWLGEESPTEEEA